jgi:predicted TIM-barrel fold metal-dependent hydrolase
MKEVIISADDHMDLSTLPQDLFAKRLAPRWRELGPKVVQGPESLVWAAEGKTLGISGKRPPSAVPYATNRAGREDDGFRPSTPALRLEDMDLDGIQAEVIYGPPLGFPLENAELKAAVLAAFNDWAAEFNRHAPDRLCVLPMLPVHDPAATAAELERVAELGHRGALFNAFQCAKPTWDRAWDPLWAAAADRSLPISLHLGGGMSMLKSQTGSWITAAVATVSPMQLDEALAALVLGGVLDRNPGLKIVLAESGIGWIPYVVERMDLEYNKHFVHGNVKDMTLDRLPSAIFRDQVFVTFEEDRLGARMIPLIGEDNVMWASDYPHPDSTFPNSRKEIAAAFAGLPDSVREKATRETCARLYHFPLAQGYLFSHMSLAWVMPQCRSSLR